jgi:hypothetical protein
MNGSISHWIKMKRKEMTRQVCRTAQLKYAAAKRREQARQLPIIQYDKTCGRMEIEKKNMAKIGA